MEGLFLFAHGAELEVVFALEGDQATFGVEGPQFDVVGLEASDDFDFGSGGSGGSVVFFGGVGLGFGFGGRWGRDLSGDDDLKGFVGDAFGFDFGAWAERDIGFARLFVPAIEERLSLAGGSRSDLFDAPSVDFIGVVVVDVDEHDIVEVPTLPTSEFAAEGTDHLKAEIGFFDRRFGLKLIPEVEGFAFFAFDLDLVEVVFVFGEGFGDLFDHGEGFGVALGGGFGTEAAFAFGGLFFGGGIGVVDDDPFFLLVAIEIDLDAAVLGDLIGGDGLSGEKLSEDGRRDGGLGRRRIGVLGDHGVASAKQEHEAKRA